MAVSLDVSNISIRFGRRWIFKNLSFKAREGDIGVITGANGSGKTTLLKILSGIIRPNSGKIDYIIGEKPIGKDEIPSFVGLLTPDLMLYDELTAFENLLFFSRLRGLPLTNEEITDSLCKAGLFDAIHQRYRLLSTGMKQKVKLLFSSIHKPSLLLLDEPTANLDISGINMVKDFVFSYKEKHIILLTSHSQKETQWGNEIVRLDKTGDPCS